MNIIAILNRKGGVGKTTTTANLAAYNAFKGYYTLAVDLDSQENLSYALSGRMGLQGLADLFSGRTSSPVLALLQKSKSVNGLNLLAAGQGLDKVTADLSASEVTAFAQQLVGYFAEIDAAYRAKDLSLDSVFLDLPPSTGKLMDIGLECATHILIPFKPDIYSAQGAGKLLPMLEEKEQQLGRPLKLLGGFINMARSDDTDKEMARMIVTHMKGRMLPVVIPLAKGVKDGDAIGSPAVISSSSSPAATQFRHLWREIRARLDGGAA